MAATVVTLGYSVSGGLTAGTSKIPTVGYAIYVPPPATADYICLENPRAKVGRATAIAKTGRATAKAVTGHATAKVECK